jgi:hypothetical protein
MSEGQKSNTSIYKRAIIRIVLQLIILTALIVVPLAVFVGIPWWLTIAIVLFPLLFISAGLIVGYKRRRLVTGEVASFQTKEISVEEQKRSKIAIASLVLGVVGLVALFVSASIVFQHESNTASSQPTTASYLLHTYTQGETMVGPDGETYRVLLYAGGIYLQTEAQYSNDDPRVFVITYVMDGYGEWQYMPAAILKEGVMPEEINWGHVGLLALPMIFLFPGSMYGLMGIRQARKIAGSIRVSILGFFICEIGLIWSLSLVIYFLV